MSLFEESDVDIICGGFPYRLSALQETDEVLKIHEEVSSLKLQGSHLFSDLNIYCLRTSKDSQPWRRSYIWNHPGALDELGYNVEWQILNSKDFGVPQNRERCSLSDILEENVPEFFLSKSCQQALIQSKSSTAIPLQPDITYGGNSQGAGAYIVESKSQKVRSIGNIHPSEMGWIEVLWISWIGSHSQPTRRGQKIAIPVLTLIARINDKMGAGVSLTKNLCLLWLRKISMEF